VSTGCGVVTLTAARRPRRHATARCVAVSTPTCRHPSRQPSAAAVQKLARERSRQTCNLFPPGFGASIVVVSKIQRPESTQQNNLRLRLLSKTKLVILKEGHCLKHAQTGRAESVPSWAYQCLSWGVSKCALFFGSGIGTRGKIMSENFVTCQCQHCDGHIEFDASGFARGETRTVECPHCKLETLIFVPIATKPPPVPPTAAKEVQPSKALPSQDNFSILTIGDIGITSDKVITPNGIGTLADSQWIFSDLSRTESKIPASAVILAIVFAIFCLIGLLFLLMRETTTTGYAEVSVHSGNLYHKVQIPIKSKAEVDRIRELVNKAQSLAALARANR